MKAIRRFIGRCVGISVFAALITMVVVALRHMLETPQPLKSQLPGESLLYIWRRHSIFYKVLGAVDAPPLVLLHSPGIGASAREMQYIMEPLAQTYRVYAPDLLGFGLSDRPNIEYSADMYIALCQDFLHEVVKQPATLVASRLSCNYAASVATGTPELCASLAFISPIALHDDQQPPSLKEFAERPPLKRLLYSLLSTRLAFRLTHERTASQDDFAHFYATTHQLGAEHAAMALLAGKLGKNTESELEALKQPILIIWGMRALEDQRNLSSLRSTPQKRQTREVELIQGAGLFVHEELPESVSAAIRRWQAEISTRLPIQAETRAQNSLESLRQQAPVEAIPEFRAEISLPAQTHTSHTPVEPTPDLRVYGTEENRATEQHEQSTGGALQALMIQAYCVKCKKKTEVLNASEFTMKNGRLAIRGICAICGTRISRIGGIN